MRLTQMVLAPLSVLFIACASGSRSADPSPAASTVNQSQLTGEEITAANLPTAYDVVARLRYLWLRADAVTGGEVTVVRDNETLGGADQLRDIPAFQVAAMRFMPNAEAIGRYGNDIKGSVIVIIPRR